MIYMTAYDVIRSHRCTSLRGSINIESRIESEIPPTWLERPHDRAQIHVFGNAESARAL